MHDRANATLTSRAHNIHILYRRDDYFGWLRFTVCGFLFPLVASISWRAAFTVRVARGVDPRPSELTMTYTIGKVDDSPYASRLCLSLAQTVPREPADYPRRAGSGPPSRKPCDQNRPQE